jgi:hypothetical protein
MTSGPRCNRLRPDDRPPAACACPSRLANLDAQLLAPIVLNQTEFDDLVGLVREALLDTRALPGNLCRLIPPFTPSGMTLMTFEGCGNSGDGAMRGRSIASASCAVSLQAPRAGGCTGNGSRASLKPQESVDCPNAATLRERVSAAFAINALISSSCMLADTAYAQWKTKYEIVSSRISWL